jgi:mannose-6-phosphate isomerase-like protein (cupin superfamily)
MKKRKIISIPTELIHHSSVYRKSLIKTGEVKGKIATMNYAWLEKGMAIQPHKHPDGEEYYFFLEDHGVMRIGKEKILVQAGDFVKVPEANQHSLSNIETEKLVFLTIRTIFEKQL